MSIKLGFGQGQARCFPLFPAFMLSYANMLLTVTSYVTDRHESYVDFVT